VRYSDAADSLGLAEFLSLPADEQQFRTLRAASWQALAEDAKTVAGQIRALRNTVGLNPLAAKAWLELADLNRWCGRHQVTRDYLTAAVPAVKRARASERELLWLRLTLLRAWYHYDRGEWYRGLAWSDSSLVLKLSDHPTMLIRGLLLAGGGRSRDATYLAKEIERLDFFLTDWRWIRGVTDFHRGLLVEAFNQLRFHPSLNHRTECFRDMGMVAEATEQWSEARRFYERSHSSLPLRENSLLVKHDRPAPQEKEEDEQVPVWLAFDRYYVTGSLIAYTHLARERFETSTLATEREFWADAALNAATVCIRKDLGQPWTRAWRGQVYAQLELDRQASQDLTRAMREFELQRRVDVGTLAWLGRVKLRQEDYRRALTLLQRAVAVDSSQARIWSDLGYALLMTEELEEALDVLDLAIAMDPTMATAWYNRGLMHFHAKQWEAAAADLQEAARLAPGNETIAEVLQRTLLMIQRSRQQP
jgi:tetratricopeptide (TPR) repeat protein